MKSEFAVVVEDLLKSVEFSKYFPFAVSALKASGVVRALRDRGRPRVVEADSANLVTAQAFEAQRSIGYNECLDDLLHFAERYAREASDQTPKLSYGAGLAALAAGDLTEEELDAIISGANPADIYNKLYLARTAGAAASSS